MGNSNNKPSEKIPQSKIATQSISRVSNVETERKKDKPQFKDENPITITSFGASGGALVLAEIAKLALSIFPYAYELNKTQMYHTPILSSNKSLDEKKVLHKDELPQILFAPHLSPSRPEIISAIETQNFRNQDLIKILDIAFMNSDVRGAMVKVFFDNLTKSTLKDTLEERIKNANFVIKSLSSKKDALSFIYDSVLSARNSLSFQSNNTKIGESTISKSNDVLEKLNVNVSLFQGTAFDIMSSITHVNAKKMLDNMKSSEIILHLLMEIEFALKGTSMFLLGPAFSRAVNPEAGKTNLQMLSEDLKKASDKDYLGTSLSSIGVRNLASFDLIEEGDPSNVSMNDVISYAARMPAISSTHINRALRLGILSNFITLELRASAGLERIAGTSTSIRMGSKSDTQFRNLLGNEFESSFNSENIPGSIADYVVVSKSGNTVVKKDEAKVLFFESGDNDDFPHDKSDFISSDSGFLRTVLDKPEKNNIASFVSLTKNLKTLTDDGSDYIKKVLCLDQDLQALSGGKYLAASLSACLKHLKNASAGPQNLRNQDLIMLSILSIIGSARLPVPGDDSSADPAVFRRILVNFVCKDLMKDSSLDKIRPRVSSQEGEETFDNALSNLDKEMYAAFLRFEKKFNKKSANSKNSDDSIFTKNNFYDIMVKSGMMTSEKSLLSTIVLSVKSMLVEANSLAKLDGKSGKFIDESTRLTTYSGLDLALISGFVIDTFAEIIKELVIIDYFHSNDEFILRLSNRGVLKSRSEALTQIVDAYLTKTLDTLFDETGNSISISGYSQNDPIGEQMTLQNWAETFKTLDAETAVPFVIFNIIKSYVENIENSSQQLLIVSDALIGKKDSSLFQDPEKTIFDTIKAIVSIKPEGFDALQALSREQLARKSFVTEQNSGNFFTNEQTIPASLRKALKIFSKELSTESYDGILLFVGLPATGYDSERYRENLGINDVTDVLVSRYNFLNEKIAYKASTFTHDSLLFVDRSKFEIIDSALFLDLNSLSEETHFFNARTGKTSTGKEYINSSIDKRRASKLIFAELQNFLSSEIISILCGIDMRCLATKNLPGIFIDNEGYNLLLSAAKHFPGVIPPDALTTMYQKNSEGYQMTDLDSLNNLLAPSRREFVNEFGETKIEILAPVLDKATLRLILDLASNPIFSSAGHTNSKISASYFDRVIAIKIKRNDFESTENDKNVTQKVFSKNGMSANSFSEIQSIAQTNKDVNDFSFDGFYVTLDVRNSNG